jgi:hypothetical protein
VNTKIKIEKLDGPPAAKAFKELDIGDWYESNSCWGLCLKTGTVRAFSVTLNRYVTDPIETWPCYVVNLTVKYRRAAS